MAIDGPNADSTHIIVDADYYLTNSLEDCGNPLRVVSHVRILPGSETKVEVPAVRNNQPATIEMYSKLAQVSLPDGQTGRLHLSMLYDPRSRLFWWNCWPLHPTQPDSVVETDRLDFLRYNSVFIAGDRIVAFSSAAAIDSGEHYPDFKAAEIHVLSVLERKLGDTQIGRSRPYHPLDTSGIPRNFFHQCMHAEMPVPLLTHVARVDGLWRLTLSGVNGNSAVLSLKDNYETADVQLSPEVPPAAIERVILPHTVAAQRGGRTVRLELREVQIRYPSDCGETGVAKVALIFDPSTHLSWWRDLSSDGSSTRPSSRHKAESSSFQPQCHTSR